MKRWSCKVKMCKYLKISDFKLRCSKTRKLNKNHFMLFWDYLHLCGFSWVELRYPILGHESCKNSWSFIICEPYVFILLASQSRHFKPFQSGYLPIASSPSYVVEVMLSKLFKITQARNGYSSREVPFWGGGEFVFCEKVSKFSVNFQKK